MMPKFAGRSTFAMISANCVAERDRGKGLPVLSARQFIGAATTALSLITGAFLLALAAGNARAQGSARGRWNPIAVLQIHSWAPEIASDAPCQQNPFSPKE